MIYVLQWSHEVDMDSKDILKALRFIVVSCCIVCVLNHAISSITQYKIRKDSNAMTERILAYYDKLSSRCFDCISGEELPSDMRI